MAVYISDARGMPFHTGGDWILPLKQPLHITGQLVGLPALFR